MSSQSAESATPRRGSSGGSQSWAGRLARGALVALILIVCLVIVLVERGDNLYWTGAPADERQPGRIRLAAAGVRRA